MRSVEDRTSEALCADADLRRDVLELARLRLTGVTRASIHGIKKRHGCSPPAQCGNSHAALPSIRNAHNSEEMVWL